MRAAYEALRGSRPAPSRVAPQAPSPASGQSAVAAARSAYRSFFEQLAAGVSRGSAGSIEVDLHGVRVRVKLGTR